MKFLIKYLAKVLPNYCFFQKYVKISIEIDAWEFRRELITPTLCEFNPWYDQIIEEKIELLGYNKKSTDHPLT